MPGAGSPVCVCGGARSEDGGKRAGSMMATAKAPLAPIPRFNISHVTCHVSNAPSRFLRGSRYSRRNMASCRGVVGT